MTNPSADSPLVRRLLDAAAYPHPTGPIRLVETHISWVFLTGPFAYKVKKPVNLGFLDFSSLERRRHFCHEEVRLSGRFAPELYVAAVPIAGPAESAVVGGGDEPLEWAVKLVQFDEREVLDRVFAERGLTEDECDRFGRDIARIEESHTIADPIEPWGRPETVLDVVNLNLDQVASRRPDLSERAGRLGAWVAAQIDGRRDRMLDRIAAGRIRECHGDLHLANIVLHDGRMMAFDAIEFNPALRWIDCASDVAFLTMDLASRGRADLAAHLRNGWIEAADDHAATGVLRVYEVYRAIVRAAVAAIRGGQTAGEAAARSRAETDRYLDLALALTTPPKPTLFCTSGVAGSGKTTVAASVVGGCGAVRLRSDVERKRLAGMEATQRPEGDAASRSLYSEAATHAVYRRLAALARDMLATGTSVVIDATCSARWQRDLIAAAARETSAPLVWIDFDVPEETLLARVASRQAAGDDASDASCEVVRRQLAAREPITNEELSHSAAAGTVARLVVSDRAPPDGSIFRRLSEALEARRGR